MFTEPGVRLLRSIFTLAIDQKPSVIFIDDFDTLVTLYESEAECPREFLVQLPLLCNQNEEDIVVLCATNIPWALDSAVRRRFTKRIYIPLPNKTERVELIKKMLKSSTHAIAEEEFIELSELTEG